MRIDIDSNLCDCLEYTKFCGSSTLPSTLFQFIRPEKKSFFYLESGFGAPKGFGSLLWPYRKRSQRHRSSLETPHCPGISYAIGLSFPHYSLRKPPRSGNGENISLPSIRVLPFGIDFSSRGLFSGAVEKRCQAFHAIYRQRFGSEGPSAEG